MVWDWLWRWERMEMRGLCACQVFAFSSFMVRPTVNEMTYLMPTPPAIKTTLLILWTSTPVGGQTKLPPTRTLISLPRISSSGLHSHAAGGLEGESWTASSTYGGRPCEGIDGVSGSSPTSDCAGETSGTGSSWASAGVEVIVNPPAWAMEGIWTSSHWPGRKANGCWVSSCRVNCEPRISAYIRWRFINGCYASAYT